MSPLLAPKPLKSRLTNGDRLRGLLVRVPAPMLIDMAGANGFDFIFLDTEHGIADQKDIAEHIIAGRAAGLPTLVRIGEGETALALRVLDAGAEGVIVPHVRTATEASAAVRLAHYPPLGDRGFATYTAAGSWGKATAAEHAAKAAATTMVVAMIEDAEGVSNAGGIAKNPGIDAVFVGPSDLAAALGYDAARADEARLEVWAVAAAARRPVMAIVSTGSQARKAWDQGASMVVLNAQSAIDSCLADWAAES
ncbi:HpcH/HpaI aldolase family protein [Arthrobacter sp. SO3]|uniref:HpcH/HpaI aldolase family protein n=1 Tax=Arthrobacter sp. SO3 TaxID=1897057 RepID=UPI001D000775|nr:aldolase/citrate lyase family protein [Arthrobacter sp. SO3]MCB5292680.1 5-keto-4-deoxy-D-glucarate aldolase [Arthrobacter sp. SO3]